MEYLPIISEEVPGLVDEFLLVLRRDTIEFRSATPGGSDTLGVHPRVDLAVDFQLELRAPLFDFLHFVPCPKLDQHSCIIRALEVPNTPEAYLCAVYDRWIVPASYQEEATSAFLIVSRMSTIAALMHSLIVPSNTRHSVH